MPAENTRNMKNSWKRKGSASSLQKMPKRSLPVEINRMRKSYNKFLDRSSFKNANVSRWPKWLIRKLVSCRLLMLS